MTDEAPLFDSVKEALVFALNASEVDMPQPFMNKAMAAFKVKPKTKKAKAAADLLGEEVKRMSLNPRKTFRGMEKAAQAGLILKQLEKLDLAHSTVLKGLLTHPWDPCACRSPCCSGRRANPRYTSALKQMCEILKEEADVARIPGKKGLGTQPHLRIMLVDNFFVKAEKSIASIAKQAQLNRLTVEAHHDLINDYLVKTEDEAWTEVAPILDQAGITGAFT